MSTCKNESPLVKWVLGGKVGHTWENGSHLEKWVTLGTVGNTWKKITQIRTSESHRPKLNLTSKTYSSLEKLVTLGKNESRLEKWVTSGQMGHTW